VKGSVWIITPYIPQVFTPSFVKSIMIGFNEKYVFSK